VVDAYRDGLALWSLFTFDTGPLVTWPTVDTGDMDLRIDSESVVAALSVRDIMAIVLLCFIVCGQVATGKLILGRDLAVEAPT
jgi:hypothetical protein